MHRSSLSFPLKLTAWCILVFGLAVSLTLFLSVYRYQQHIEAANFERRAQFRVAAVQQGMNNAIEALRVVNQLFATNGEVSREQFHSFTQPLRSRHPYIEAFAFQRLVTQDERPAFEARMRSLYPGFTIDELVDGKRVQAAVKDRYHVIDYREPMELESAVGLDASSKPFQDAVRRTEDTGLPSATGLFQLLKGGGQHSFRIVMAVYRSGAAHGDVASRRLAVAGYTVAVLRARELFEKILASVGSSGNAGLDIRIYAAASADERKLVYGKAGAAPIDTLAQWRPGWLFANWPKPHSRNFDVAGTAWHMAISAQPAPFCAVHASALLALLVSLLTTLAATAYLQLSSSRARRIEQLVAQRTDEVQRANALLMDDILARRQVEQALVVSEDRSRELAGLSSDWYWEQDEHFCFTNFSTGMNNGGPPLFMLGSTRWELQVDPDASDWPAHRAVLEAHQMFRNFEFKLLFKTLMDGMPVRWVSVSGKPQFDADGLFTGYRGTARNISVRKEAEEALRRSRTQLRKLADHQEGVREEERKRIARDIHDDLGQNLMALRIDVSMMAAGNDALPRERIDAVLKQIDITIKAVRVIINDLRPAVLDLGLQAAVEWLAREFERRSGIVCELHLDYDECPLGNKRATYLFRIVQESLANIMRHAKADHVQIEIRQRDGELFIKIADNGIGLSPDCGSKAKGFGLVGIEERIHALGGTFSLASNPGRGTAIILSIPIDAGATSETPVAPQHGFAQAKVQATDPSTPRPG